MDFSKKSIESAPTWAVRNLRENGLKFYHCALGQKESTLTITEVEEASSQVCLTLRLRFTDPLLIFGALGK